MDMELDNMGTQEPQEPHEDGEFDEMLKDLWGDDYTTEDDEGADPAPRRETGTPEAALRSKVLDPLRNSKNIMRKHGVFFVQGLRPRGLRGFGCDRRRGQEKGAAKDEETGRVPTDRREGEQTTM